MRIFFQVTGVLIILFAAGLLSRSVQFFQAAGDLGTVNNAAYDVTGASWLTIDTESGKVLAGILGWDPRPSIEQVVVYFGYLIPVLVAFFWSPRRSRPAAGPGADLRGRRLRLSRPGPARIVGPAAIRRGGACGSCTAWWARAWGTRPARARSSSAWWSGTRSR